MSHLRGQMEPMAFEKEISFGTQHAHSIKPGSDHLKVATLLETERHTLLTFLGAKLDFAIVRNREHAMRFVSHS